MNAACQDQQENITEAKQKNGKNQTKPYIYTSRNNKAKNPFKEHC